MLQQPLNLGFSDLGAPSGGVVAIRGRRKERWPHVLPRVPSIPQETRAPVFRTIFQTSRDSLTK